MDPSVFPEEIWIKILLECDVPDIIALGSTCKLLRKTIDTDYLWKSKWIQLISNAKFQFPRFSDLQNLSVSFKSMCYRLHMILTMNKESSFPKCCNCASYTCERNCVEGSSNNRVVIEIGNKFTWVITPNFGLRRHFSMLGFPRYNSENHIQQPLTTQNISNGSSRRKSEGKFVTKKSIAKLLKLSEPEAPKAPPRSGPFCVFCNTVQLYREKRRELCPSDISCHTRCNPIYQKLINGYCSETKALLGIPNIDLVNPAEALLSVEVFPVLKNFIDHLFRQMCLTEVLRRPNAVLIFCEPLAIHPLVRKHLLHYLFQEVKIARVCLVPKPLAIACAMLNVETCIVIDSGALKTTVAVVVNGRVQCWKLIPVGGWHVAHYLKQAMDWQPKEFHEIPISHLDYPTVKERCRLSLDIRNEEFNNKYDKFSKNGQSKSDKVDIDIRVDTYSNCKKDWKVSLGPELFTAPELMYLELDLAKVVEEVTMNLCEETREECLRNILLTGGNTDLSGFEMRLEKDLRGTLPEYAHIRVKSCPGTHSWNVAMGSTYVPLAVHPDQSPPEYLEGNPFWLSREEYILFGCESLANQKH